MSHGVSRTETRGGHVRVGAEVLRDESYSNTSTFVTLGSYFDYFCGGVPHSRVGSHLTVFHRAVERTLIHSTTEVMVRPVTNGW